MLFDFKINRFIAVIGLIGLAGFLYGFMAGGEIHPLLLLVLTFGYVFILGRVMRTVAINGYRAIHQRLFIYADAKGYLEAVGRMYTKTARRRDIHGVKLQNIIMAYVFAGDYNQAKTYFDQYEKTYAQAIEHDPKVKFSHGLMDAMIGLFTFDKERFKTAYDRIDEILNQMPPGDVQHVRDNPYSIFHMMTLLYEVLFREDKVTINAAQARMKQDNPFVNSAIFYVLTKYDQLEESDFESFKRENMNTMFYLDTEY